jgi:hypothetical protein
MLSILRWHSPLGKRFWLPTIWAQMGTIEFISNVAQHKKLKKTLIFSKLLNGKVYYNSISMKYHQFYNYVLKF